MAKTQAVLQEDPGVPSERRHEPRYRVAVPVILEHGVGWTRDLSATGAYFKYFDKPSPLPQPGTHLHVDFVLEHVDPREPFNVACNGEILRVEQDAAHVGLAVRIAAYRFPPPSPRETL